MLKCWHKQKAGLEILVFILCLWYPENEVCREEGSLTPCCKSTGAKLVDINKWNCY